MKQTRKQYTKSFKEDAVRLVTEQKYSCAAAARSLGLNATMLSRWIQEFKQEDDKAFRGHGRMTPEQEELQRLRAENKRLKMEREILVKATAFFAKESS
jgi:transposase